MPSNRHPLRSSLVLGGFLFILLVVSVALLTRSIQQENRNRALIAAVVANNDRAVLELLREGADPNARLTPTPSASLWRRMLLYLRPRREQYRAPSALVVALTPSHFANIGETDKLNRLRDMSQYTKAVEQNIATAGFGKPGFVLQKHMLIPTWQAESSDKARMQRHTAIVRALIAAGANPNAIGKYGYTPLMFAVNNGETPDIVRALLQHGANLEARTGKGQTPLMIATHAGEAELLSLLLDAGADINAETSEGNTALFEVFANEEKTIEVLVDHYVNLNHQNKAGKLALCVTQGRVHKPTTKRFQLPDTRGRIAPRHQ